MLVSAGWFSKAPLIREFDAETRSLTTASCSIYNQTFLLAALGALAISQGSPGIVQRMSRGPFSSPDNAGRSLPGAGCAEFVQGTASAMAVKWSTLQDAASVVATLAGLAPEPRESDMRDFPALIRDTGGWRKSLAEQGIDDLSAVMEPGIVALLAATARGVVPSAAALTLWHEFVRTRSALLELVAPRSGHAPPCLILA